METQTPKPRRRKWLLILLAVLLVLAVAVPLIVLAVSKAFTAQESVVRSDWADRRREGSCFQRKNWQIEYAEADLGDEGMRALYLVPMDIEEEGFTFYDTEVQQRLAGALEELKTVDHLDRRQPAGGGEPLRHRQQRPVPVLHHRHAHRGAVHRACGRPRHQVLSMGPKRLVLTLAIRN